MDAVALPSASQTNFKGTWYVKAFGRCIRMYRNSDHLFTEQEAKQCAASVQEQHRAWVTKNAPMDGITLALIASWMDATLRKKEWHPPTSKRQLREIVRKYYFGSSPYKRSAVLEICE